MRQQLLSYAAVVFCTCVLSACLLTKVVSVPMRVAGAVVSVLPVAGDAGHAAIDAAANTVDELPF